MQDAPTGTHEIEAGRDRPAPAPDAGSGPPAWGEIAGRLRGRRGPPVAKASRGPTASGLRMLACLALALMVLVPSTVCRALTPFTDEELIDGFIQTVFGAEMETARDQPGSRLVKKFTGPVHYQLVSTARDDRRGTVRRFLQELDGAVENLTLREAETPNSAEMVIYLVDRADYVATIRSTVWDGVDTVFLEENACSAVIASRPRGIERAHIYLVADEGFLGLAHCLVEEVAQSLGPANDSTLLADSIFNDQSEINVFGIFDWFILNMLYDPRIRPGMTEGEVRPLLRQVIASARLRLPQVLAAGTGLAHHDDAAR